VLTVACYVMGAGFLSIFLVNVYWRWRENIYKRIDEGVWFYPCSPCTM